VHLVGFIIRKCVCVCVFYVCMNETVVCHLNNYKLLFHILTEEYKFESKSVKMKMASLNINIKQSQLSQLKGTEGKSCSLKCLMILETSEVYDGRYHVSTHSSLTL
jgi:hypothetical protein